MILLDVPDAVVYIIWMSLGYHLDGAAEQIAHKAGQLVTISHGQGCKAKADTLHSTDESYTFGSLIHSSYYALKVTISQLFILT